MQARNDGTYLFSPKDLLNFLGCSHSTVLDIRAFAEPLKPDDESESELLLRRKGNKHEAAYLKTLKEDGKSVAEIPKQATNAERARLTREAMRRGDDVIFQAALLSQDWVGYADFLIKNNTPSTLGPFSYEATDTKLARQPQVKHLIQLGVYSDLLGGKQGVPAQQCHLVLGDNSRVSFRVGDYASYVRHAMRRLEDFAASPPANSYPQPCSHCSECHWKDTCDARWEDDDHLSLVANIRRSQVARLEDAGVTTVAQLAVLSPDKSIPDLSSQVLERLRAQAALQDHKRRTGKNKLELLVSDPGRGFGRLSKPDAGDLFFDMEGDPLYQLGLEYLFGLCFLKDGKLAFRAFWAHDHDEERAAFIAFMGFVQQHLAEHPGAHIYHFNHYETTALKRLACRYAVAEHQLDDLLRGMKFIDLYQVVRESIRVSESAYSLKNLETFYMGPRDGDVKTAGDSIVVYNQWRETGDDRLLEEIAKYNEVDCVSTAKLRDWLLTLRPENSVWFDGPPVAAESEGNSGKSTARIEREARYADYQTRLAAAAPNQADFRRNLADLLGFHAREGKPQWWEFFDRQKRSDDELLDDTECLAGLKLVGTPEPVKKSLLYMFQFPAQETKRRAGEQVLNVATGTSAGRIEHIDEVRCVVGITRGIKSGPLPEVLNVGPGGPINTDALREAIYRIATAVLAESIRYSAVRDILSKAVPRLKGRHCGEAIASGDDLLAPTIEAIASLDDSYLFLQGPPGSGKTFASAHVIVELIRRGKKVGVAAHSHKVIHNLLDRIQQTAKRLGVGFEGIKKSSAGNLESEYESDWIHSESKTDAISLDATLVAGTAWLFADERFDQHFDYLFIDEAGQVSVANVVAMGLAARNIILVGDQMQLGQPTQAVHPGEAGSSILDLLLGTQATVAPNRGIFLNRTWRLHPSVCQFISEAFYEGWLMPDPGNAGRQLVFHSPIAGIAEQGIHFLAANHSGCSQKSEEEGRIVRHYFQQLLGQRFVDKDGSSRELMVNDILVVSPYNVQVNHLKRVLPEGTRVGTVDKFQGQEAPIVLISMATSDAECLPRDIDFHFSANRLNVAVSRAQCLAVVVASPLLLETPCRTIEQLRLVNKFCRLVEYASPKGRAR